MDFAFNTEPQRSRLQTVMKLIKAISIPIAGGIILYIRCDGASIGQICMAVWQSVIAHLVS